MTLRAGASASASLFVFLIISRLHSYIDMKKIFLFITAVVAIVVMGSCSTKEGIRDYTYEAYCDSIYEADPDYYLDVLCETDEYCSYVEKHGEWWDD